MSQVTPVTAVVIILAVWVLIATLAVLNLIGLPLPPPWLEAWSKLLTTVALAAIGARVLWSAPTQLQKYLDRPS
jgi:hypothetical protein